MNVMRIEVEFLSGRCAAADPFHRERVEWPLSPARLFAALASAAYESGDEDGLRTLRWLEAQPPPTVHAGDMSPRLNGRSETPQHFVPVNDTRAKERKRVPRVFPSACLTHPIAQFVWPEVESPQPHRNRTRPTRGARGLSGRISERRARGTHRPGMWAACIRTDQAWRIVLARAIRRAT